MTPAAPTPLPPHLAAKLRTLQTTDPATYAAIMTKKDQT